MTYWCSGYRNLPRKKKKKKKKKSFLLTELLRSHSFISSFIPPSLCVFQHVDWRSCPHPPPEREKEVTVVLRWDGGGRRRDFSLQVAIRTFRIQNISIEK